MTAIPANIFINNFTHTILPFNLLLHSTFILHTPKSPPATFKGSPITLIWTSININHFVEVRLFMTPYKRKAQCGDYQQQDTYVPKGRDNENK